MGGQALFAHALKTKGVAHRAPRGQTEEVAGRPVRRPRPPEAREIASVADYDFVREGVLRLVAVHNRVLTPAQIGKAVGAPVGSPGFNGAICRWTAFGASQMTITFNWFEWGSVMAEQRTAKKMGYATENVKINGSSAFTQTKSDRNICGVTAKAPSRGIYTWFVETLGPPSGDPCDGPTKLMELVLKASA